MKHSFNSAFGNTEQCIICGYNEKSHGKQAVCEACGIEQECELFPDTKHPKKMLLCEGCKNKELAAAVKATNDRIAAQKAHESVRTSGEYFNANIPAIIEIKQKIDSDNSIAENQKVGELAKSIKDRLAHLKNVLFEKRNEVSALENEQRESLIYMNHLMKQLSEEKQKELGLKDINYKPGSGKDAKPKAPSLKKFDKEELRKVANIFNIDMAVLQTIVVQKKCTVEEAAKLYITMSNKVESTKNQEQAK